MSSSRRKALEAAVYKHTHRDFKGRFEDGSPYVLVGSSRGTTFRPLSQFSDAELLERLPAAKRAGHAAGHAAGVYIIVPPAHLRKPGDFDEVLNRAEARGFHGDTVQATPAALRAILGPHTMIAVDGDRGPFTSHHWDVVASNGGLISLYRKGAREPFRIIAPTKADSAAFAKWLKRQLGSGHVEGMTVATHLLAAAVGYGVARAVEEPEKTRELAQRAHAKLASEGKRAYASAKTIAGRASGYGAASALDALDAAARDLHAMKPDWPVPHRIVSRSLVEVRLSRRSLGHIPSTSGEFDVLGALERHGLVRTTKPKGAAFVETDLAKTIPLSAFDDRIVQQAKDALEAVGRASGRKPTPRSYAERLWANSDAFHNDQINYSTFSRNNNQIWSEVDAAGRETHDKVLALLRKETRGARR